MCCRIGAIATYGIMAEAEGVTAGSARTGAARMLLLVGSLAGTGSFEGASSGPSGDRTGAPPRGASGSAAADGVLPDPEACTPAVTGVPLRRLTRHEYQNSIADLFAGTKLPPLDLPDDPVVGLLENNARALGPTQPHAEAWYANARAVASAVTPSLMARLPCRAADGLACARQLVDWLGRRIFRRPLDEGEKTTFGTFFATSPGT